MVAQTVPVASRVENQVAVEVPVDYVLAPGDEVSVRVLDLEEIPDRPTRIDRRGDIDLPLTGRIRADGKTTKQLENDVRERLRAYLKSPAVTVTLAEQREQPVTVLGAVNAPGVKQIRGRKTLVDAISEAGGLRADAGSVLKITRLVSAGPIPLSRSHLDSGAGFYVAEVDVTSLLKAQNPGENIPLADHDVVTVPSAEMVFILGEVSRPGGYEVKGDKTIPILDAVALAGGINRNASASHAKVLRREAGQSQRTEFVVNLNRMLGATGKDFALLPQDILYIPTNRGKVITTRALEAMIGTGSSIAVFRGSR